MPPQQSAGEGSLSLTKSHSSRTSTTTERTQLGPAPSLRQHLRPPARSGASEPGAAPHFAQQPKAKAEISDELSRSTCGTSQPARWHVAVLEAQAVALATPLPLSCPHPIPLQCASDGQARPHVSVPGTVPEALARRKFQESTTMMMCERIASTVLA